MLGACSLALIEGEPRTWWVVSVSYEPLRHTTAIRSGIEPIKRWQFAAIEDSWCYHRTGPRRRLTNRRPPNRSLIGSFDLGLDSFW